MRVLVAVLGVLVLSACGASSAPPNTDADLKAIAALRDAYVAAFSAEDAEKTAALFATDALYMADKAQQVIGRDKIRDRYREIMAGMDCDIQLKAEETVVNGEWGFERGQTWVQKPPDFDPSDFDAIRPWSGLRPCSPDGLPYIGRTASYKNLSLATGHAKGAVVAIIGQNGHRHWLQKADHPRAIDGGDRVSARLRGSAVGSNGLRGVEVAP
jgi:ketosteroid isomerase-like protein